MSLPEQTFLPANRYPHGPDPASWQPYGGNSTKTNELIIPTAFIATERKRHRYVAKR